VVMHAGHTSFLLLCASSDPNPMPYCVQRICLDRLLASPAVVTKTGFGYAIRRTHRPTSRRGVRFREVGC
jgi:hypothetical protein